MGGYAAWYFVTELVEIERLACSYELAAMP